MVVSDSTTVGDGTGEVGLTVPTHTAGSPGRLPLQDGLVVGLPPLLSLLSSDLLLHRVELMWRSEACLDRRTAPSGEFERNRPSFHGRIVRKGDTRRHLGILLPGELGNHVLDSTIQLFVAKTHVLPLSGYGTRLCRFAQRTHASLEMVRQRCLRNMCACVSYTFLKQEDLLENPGGLSVLCLSDVNLFSQNDLPGCMY